MQGEQTRGLPLPYFFKRFIAYNAFDMEVIEVFLIHNSDFRLIEQINNTENK